jgi:hypothetical protein
MPFTLDALATELGIDPATLTGKADVVAKWNGYLSEADTQYRSAKTMKEEAEAKLAAVEAEQKVINDNIAAFGVTEANTAALRANYAAMEASLKELKAQGFNVNIPDAPKVADPVKNEFNPDAFRNDVNQSLILGFDMNNRYQRLYGQPMPDDLQTLLRESQQQRKPIQVYVAEKYDFPGREKSQREEAQKKHDDEIAAKAVAKFREENPVTAGHPDLARGVASRHPQVVRERPALDKGFANMSQREKIARSVAATTQVLKSRAG